MGSINRATTIYTGKNALVVYQKDRQISTKGVTSGAAFLTMTEADAIQYVIRGLLLRRKETQDVVAGGVYEQAEYESKSNVLCNGHGALAYWRTLQLLHAQEQQVAAVQHGYGQQVQYGELQTYDAHKVEQFPNPYLCRLIRSLGDHDYAAHGLGRHPLGK